MSRKEELKKAMKATSWDEAYGFYFTIDYMGDELHGSFDFSAEELEKADPAHVKKVVLALEKFDRQALDYIQEMHPDEDASELDLSDIIFYQDGSFALGYDTGDSPAGQLYIYVKFNCDFTMDKELIFETY